MIMIKIMTAAAVIIVFVGLFPAFSAGLANIDPLDLIGGLIISLLVLGRFS